MAEGLTAHPSIARAVGVVALGGLLALGGCLDVEQDLWIETDGSARLRIDLGLERRFLRRGIDPFAEVRRRNHRNVTRGALDPKVLWVDTFEYESEGRVRSVFDVAVRDPGAIVDLQRAVLGPFAADRSIRWRYELERLGPERMAFRQRLGLGSGASRPPLDTETSEGLVDTFGSGRVVVRLHAPIVLETNGTRHDDHTVEWSTPVTDLWGGVAFTLTAEVGGLGGIPPLDSVVIRPPPLLAGPRNGEASVVEVPRDG